MHRLECVLNPDFDPAIEKIRSSIIVIGFQKEGPGMYPHLYDFLQNLRSAYEEVIYLDDDDRGDGLYSFDRFIHNILSVRGTGALVRKLRHDTGSFIAGIVGSSNHKKSVFVPLHAAPPSFYSIAKDILKTFRKFFMHFVKRRKLASSLYHMEFKFERRLLIAIDHTAAYMAAKHFKGKVILWSFDIPTKDYDSNHHMRIQGGIYEKLITADGALNADVVLIQDETRKKLLEEAIEYHFKKTIYLPVSLNDSVSCIDNAQSRLTGNRFAEVRILQCGGIGKRRLSDKLIDAYEHWPQNYKLSLHGALSYDIDELVGKAKRKPDITTFMYDHEELVTFLKAFDIGFVGYAENDRNHDNIENASGQLVAFLRSGIPVIASGSTTFNDFVAKHKVGIGVLDLQDIQAAIEKIIGNYGFYSANSRKLFEERFNLSKIFQETLIPSLNMEMMPVSGGTGCHKALCH